MASRQAEGMRRNSDELLRNMGEELQVVRDGVPVATIHGTPGKVRGTYALVSSAELQIGDTLRRPKGEPLYVTDIDYDTIGTTVIGVTAHVETTAQRQQRIAAAPPPTYQIGTVYNSIIGSQQTVTQINTGSPADRAQLQQLLADFNAALQTVPPEHTAEATKAAKRVETAVQEAAKPEPDHEVVTFNLESLQKAATNLATVTPTILPVAMQIVERIRAMLP
jgi:hypothetical protein